MRKLSFIKRINLLIIIGLATVLSAQAQEVNVKGTITSSDDGQPLIGANVVVKGTTTGTVTNVDGVYEIKATAKDTLVFSFIGYLTEEVAIGGRNMIDYSLAPDAESLSEVVVVGYGARRKEDVTGSVSSVKSSELNAFPVLEAMQAVQGRAAGVDIQSNNGGEPGAPIGIKIRGNTSINASSSPLIVVDGFVGANMPQAGDIESMQILKDASATAIYGSQGSNGVILVTTKKGKSGKLNIDFNATYSVQNTTNRLDLLNAEDFTTYQNAVRENVAITKGETATEFVPAGADTDWQDEIYRAGSTQNYQLSFSGGSEKINCYASGTYFKQDGILVNSGFEKASFLSNIDAQVTNKLKVGLNLTGGKSTKDGVATQSDGSVTVGGDDVVSLAMRFAPDKPIFNEDGTVTTNDVIGDEVDNPYAVATQRVDETEIENFRSNFFANYEIIEGLEFKTTFGLSTENEFRGIYMPRTLPVTASAVDGFASIRQDKDKSVLSENYLTYKRDILEGTLTLLAGYSYQKTTEKGFFTSGQGTISDAFSYYGLYTATTLNQAGAGDVYVRETEIQSQFGRLNYDYADKYLITGTVRRDGASNFAKNEKHAIFPSAALGWKISNESFMQNVGVVSNLKLRASYGVTGNPSILPYNSLASSAIIYASSGGSTVPAVTPNQPANPDLKWESSYQTNLGLDLGLLQGKVNLSIDYYNIDTKDLIMVDRSLPDYTGFYNNAILKNVGEINNKGFEITINTRNINTSDFRWTTDFVLSHNKNSVVALVDGDDWFGNGAPSYFSVNNTYVLREGEEVGLFWGYDFAGVYQGGAIPAGTALIPASYDPDGNPIPGEPLFKDIADEDGNTDGTIDEADKTIIGNPNPDFTWGITNDFTYKNWDLSIFFQGSQGNKIFNMTNVQLYNGDANTTYEYFENAWTPENGNNEHPRVGNSSFREMSSRFVEDGSYIRLKNVSLGYTVPKEIASKLNLQKARISVSAQNLLTITKYSGLDPEVNYYGAAGVRNGDNSTAINTVRGFDFGNYPNVRSISFSLNLTF